MIDSFILANLESINHKYMNGKSSPKWHGCYPIQATGIIIGAYNFRTAALQLSRKELDYLHLKEFQNCEYDCTSGNIDTITHKISVIPWILDLSSKLDNDQLSLSL